MTELADTIIAHYERHAEAWDADRRRLDWNDRAWHDRFVKLLPRGGCVLDLGCGGGDPVAVNLATHGMAVTGVDSSPTLISLCRSRMPRHEWIVGDMRSLALGRTFDGVQAWDSFFHLKPADQRAMFPVFAAHASPAPRSCSTAVPPTARPLAPIRATRSTMRAWMRSNTRSGWTDRGLNWSTTSSRTRAPEAGRCGWRENADAGHLMSYWNPVAGTV
jgi:SAM-dependent methyltransferase